MNTYKFVSFFIIIFLVASHSKAQKISNKIKYADIELLDGNILKEEALTDKVIVINLWGTWCAPCIKEFPILNEIQEEFAENQDVLFLAITDPRSDNAEKINTLLKKKPFNFIHLTPALESIFFKLGSSVSVPKTVIYDKTGNKIKEYEELSEEDLPEVKSRISEVLGE